MVKYNIDKQDFEWEPVEGHKYGLNKLDNIYMPMLYKKKNEIKNFEVQHTDRYILGYPKSGTTWVEEMVWLIENNLDFERSKSESHYTRVPFIDRFLQEIVIGKENCPRVFKSHLPLQFLPDDIEKKSKVIYVMRNPKDMICSTFNFLKTLKEDEFIGSFETLVENFLEGKTWYGSWWDHIDQFVTTPGIFLIKYEDLLEKPFENVKALANFLGKSLSDSELMSLISFCSFDQMKNNPSFEYRDLKQANLIDEKFTFFVKGQIGNWRNYFSDDLSTRFDQVIEKKLKHENKFKYVPSKEVNAE